MSNQFNVHFLASGVQPGREISPSLKNHFSRRKQFFLSLSVSLSPFFTSCGSLISIDELHNFLVRKLEGTEKSVYFDGTEFQAILLNDRQRRGIGELWDVTSLAKRPPAPDICWYECIDEELQQLLQESDAKSTGAFVTKFLGCIDMTQTVESARAIDVSDREGSLLAEAFVASQLENKNIIKPSVYFLARNISSNGNIYKGVHGLSPYQGVGDLYDFMFSSLWDSKHPIHKRSSRIGKVPLREAIMAPIIKGFIEGLKHIHDSKFVFGDLKLENIIVCEDHKQELGYTGKLIDFGASCKEGRVTRPAGTVNHLAPEFAAEKLTRKRSSDIWALGTNLFLLFNADFYRRLEDYADFQDEAKRGNLMFNTNDDQRMKVKNLSASLKELIRMLLVVDPEKRPNCDEILKAPWFKECDEVINDNDNKDFLEATLREMAEKSRLAIELRRASEGKELENEQIETYEEDQPVPREKAYLYSPDEKFFCPKEYKIKNKSQPSRDAQQSPSTAGFGGGANGSTNIPLQQQQQQQRQQPVDTEEVNVDGLVISEDNKENDLIINSDDEKLIDNSFIQNSSVLSNGVSLDDSETSSVGSFQSAQESRRSLSGSNDGNDSQTNSLSSQNAQSVSTGIDAGVNEDANNPPLQLQQQVDNEIKEENVDGVSNVSTSSFESKSSNRVFDQESIPSSSSSSSSGTPTSSSAPSSPNSKSDPTSVSVDLTRQQQHQQQQNKLNRIPSEKPKEDSKQTTSSDSPVTKSPGKIPKNNKNNKNDENDKNNKNDKNDKIANPKMADVSRLRCGFCWDGLRSLKKKTCAMIDNSNFCRRLFCLNKK